MLLLLHFYVQAAYKPRFYCVVFGLSVNLKNTLASFMTLHGHGSCLTEKEVTPFRTIDLSGIWIL